MIVFDILTRVALYSIYGLVMLSAGITVQNWRYWVGMFVLVSVDVLSYIKGARDAR